MCTIRKRDFRPRYSTLLSLQVLIHSALELVGECNGEGVAFELSLVRAANRHLYAVYSG